MARYRQELEHLTAAVVSPTDLQVQLDYCIAKLMMLQEAWRSGTALERRTTLHGIFEEIVIDLDTRRITAFRLKTWAMDYLKACASQLSEQGTAHDGHAVDPDQILLRVLYHGAAPVVPPFDRAAKQVRNHSISERYCAGETLEELSRAYGITPQRVHQIVRGHRK